MPGERAPEARQREGVRLRRVETKSEELKRYRSDTSLTSCRLTIQTLHVIYLTVHGMVCTRMRTPPHAFARGTGEKHSAEASACGVENNYLLPRLPKWERLPGRLLVDRKALVPYDEPGAIPR